MKREVYAQFLNENCATAYSQYKSGYLISGIGWVLFGFGISADLGSVLALFSSQSQNKTTLALGLIGGAFEIASIPMLCVGYARMHRSADTFNMTCKQQSQAYWSINASQNGLGLALHF